MQATPYSFEHLMDITARPAQVFVRGEGAHLWDQHGRRYLDFVQGWAVNAFGHSPRVIADALAAQSRLLVSPSPAFWNEPSLRLANLLCGHSHYSQVFFTSSGAEANEGAIKLARKYGRKLKGGAFEIITMVDGFHGRTLATMSASGKPGWDTMFAPQVPGFPKARLNDLASVEALVNANTVAVMLEPVQGEAGVLPATREFMHGLRALCDRHGLLLIADEVQTGMGRLGTLFGCEAYGVEPDVCTLGKGIGAGVPLGALLATRKASVFEHGEQGGTYCGNPLMTAVGAAVVEALLAPGFLAQVRETGEHLSQRLTALSQELGLGPERGIGLLRALDLGAPIGAKVVEVARDAGLLLNSPRPNALRFMPALNVSREEIEALVDGLRGAVRAVRA